MAILGRAADLPSGAHLEHGGIRSDALEFGLDGIRPIPLSRWDASFVHLSRDLPNHGGFLRDPLSFDAEIFAMSHQESSFVDPQQRLLLGQATRLHHQHPRGLLAGADMDSSCGVAVGISLNDYAEKFARLSPGSPYMATGGHLSAASGRLCYALGYHGFAISVDTACSSSLVATHLGCREIRPPSSAVNRAVAAGATWCSPRGGAWCATGPRCCRQTAGARPWTPPRMGTLGPSARGRSFWRGWTTFPTIFLSAS